MPFPRGAGLDPVFQNRNLAGLQFAMRLRGRHLLIRIRRVNPPPGFALRKPSRERLRDPSFLVEPQLRFTLPVVRSVTMKAVGSEDWPHVAVELDVLRE